MCLCVCRGLGGRAFVAPARFYYWRRGWQLRLANLAVWSVAGVASAPGSDLAVACAASRSPGGDLVRADQVGGH